MRYAPVNACFFNALTFEYIFPICGNYSVFGYNTLSSLSLFHDAGCFVRKKIIATQ